MSSEILSEPFLILVILAITPVIFLLWFFYHLNRYKKKSKKLMTITFLLGAISIIPAIILEVILRNLIHQGLGLLSIFIYYMIGVALVEESLKFTSIKIYAYKSQLFDEPMDGLVLGVTAGLGFATVENLGYVLHYGAVDAIVRSLTSVPAHALYGAIIGYYLGEAKFRKKPSLAFVGLALAIFLHGIFDTLTSVVPDILGVGMVFLMILAIYFGIVRKEVRTAEAESPYKTVTSY